MEDLMKFEDISNAGKQDIAQDIAKLCGEVTVECADTAGVIEKQMESVEIIRKKQDILEEQSDKLFNELALVVEATDSASELAQNAKSKLINGNETIENALESFRAIVELTDKQSKRIASLAGALDQVRNVTTSIDQIAKTTNMLALNAAIEAEKAGDAGATFAVVASEVKKLSNDTRVSADEITQTVNSLSYEALSFMEEMKDGISENKLAQNQLVDLQALISDVSDIVQHVESKNIDIADNSATIYDAEKSNSKIRKEVNIGNDDMRNNLSKAHHQMNSLEEKSNIMFDVFVKSGLSPDDESYVNRAIESRDHIQKITELAIARGEISLDDIFDKNLIKITGSNPERYYNRLTKWSDDNWRPIYDKVFNSSDNIKSLICSSQEGYLPTHMSIMSKTPTGNIDYDTPNCRNGRVIFYPAELHIKQSNSPYTMAVYRQEGDGNNYILLRNVYVPLFIKGRRWGDVELAYVL